MLGNNVRYTLEERRDGRDVVRGGGSYIGVRAGN